MPSLFQTYDPKHVNDGHDKAGWQANPSLDNLKPIEREQQSHHINGVKEAGVPVGIKLAEKGMWRRIVFIEAIEPDSVLHGKILAGDKVLEVNNVKVKSAKKAARAIKEASKLSIKVMRQPPPALDVFDQLGDKLDAVVDHEVDLAGGVLRAATLHPNEKAEA